MTEQEPLDTEDLRCRAAELEEAGWSDIEDARHGAVPAFYAAADEIDRLRALLSQPTEELPNIVESFAPGVKFTAIMFDDSVRHQFVRGDEHRPVIEDTGAWRHVGAIDPSTVRDIAMPTPPSNN